MWIRIKSFFAFYIQAITKYNVQSPFLYDFVTYVLDTEKEFYSFQSIEDQRKRLKSIKDVIKTSDYGAGSTSLTLSNRKVSDIANTSLSGVSKCRTLFNIVNHYHCLNILELGSSLGISSAYLASANQHARVITLEGDENIASIAAEVHQLLGLKNINIVRGPFQQTLSENISKFESIDLAFIDGHHLELPTIQYFEMIITKCNDRSIVVVDDIYWSKEMTSAWHKIIENKKVTLSIDLYDVGIVFFRKELSKQHVAYLPYKYKPWKIGLFG
jgi:precorrin-6B methylase 2